MRTKGSWIRTAVVLCIGIGGGLLLPDAARAHCDTMDGPVVKDAKRALARGDVTPALKWVKKESEAEVRAAFKKTLIVRSKGPEAKEIADRYFFETLVRLHRASEGEPFTGLKPSGTDPGPVVAGADKALDSGSVAGLVKLVTEDAAAGLRKRFADALAKKRRADTSVEAGRKYVAAYVEFVHYAERLHMDATGQGVGHGEEREARTDSGHEHD